MKPNYYAILPAEVRYSENLSPNSKLLFAEISALTNKSGKCYAQNSYFAELYNVEKETVSRWISQLEKFGFIKTKVIRNENKQVERRYIFVNTSLQKNQYPIDKKVKGNIYTNNNNINNNSSYAYSEQVLKSYDFIVALFPDRNKPKNENQKKQWLDVIRLCNSEDKINPRQLYYLLEKVRSDEFWSVNFLSLLSLRKSVNGVRKLDRFLQKFADENFKAITK
jgi:DNA-binding MarR family transcriptional regulator